MEKTHARESNAPITVAHLTRWQRTKRLKRKAAWAENEKVAKPIAREEWPREVHAKSGKKEVVVTEVGHLEKLVVAVVSRSPKKDKASMYA